MQLLDVFKRAGIQRNHRAITSARWLLVKGPAYAQSDGVVMAERPPGCAFFITASLWMSKQFHQWIVEPYCSL
ncbi:hypothetical protein AB07_3380 [Citrobacter freundii]|nr:hypothetical protein AB07_3380 [Citrobacter freundii]